MKDLAGKAEPVDNNAMANRIMDANAHLFTLSMHMMHKEIRCSVSEKRKAGDKDDEASKMGYNFALLAILLVGLSSIFGAPPE